ncbi:MAG: toll/interleukin-1 receptor domain-containing protein [Gammaproteobacteria bacterium]|nr:toll/interleukin-1 receptor domain-containing protein [Gammaproteobacteria bacterium]
MNEPTLKLFISYSRADAAFADELVAGLEYDGRYQVTIDRHSIIEGEDWKARLGALIADADTIVFILSPASARSDICAWEVEEAHRLSKRILPALAAPVGSASVPVRLAALNYVRFDPLEDGRPRSFMAGLTALVRALNTDVAWLREHTRYQGLARSWDQAGRPDNRLLSGSDVATAKRWASERPKDAPEITALHLDYIRASEAVEAARANAERQRLAEVDAAQRARADALGQLEQATVAKLEASRRLVRRTVALAVVGILLVLALAGAMGLYARWQAKLAQTMEEAANKQDTLLRQLQSETERADQFIRLVDKNPAGRRAMEKICIEAVDVTHTLASTASESAYVESKSRFFELYYGPMYIVEIHQAKHSSGRSDIESSMVRFGRQLEALDLGDLPLPRTDLCRPAQEVRDACVAYLDVSARNPCE